MKTKKASEPQDFVICRECGEMIQFLPPHLRVHNMVVTEYLKKHPKAPIYSDRYRRNKNSAIKNRDYKRRKPQLTGIEGMNFVTCLECDRRMMVIPSSHLRNHGMTRDEYREKYPGARLERGIRKSRKHIVTTRENIMWAILLLFGTEPEDFIVCRICGKMLRCMSWTHLKYKHNMAQEEYIVKYPDAVLMSDVYRGALSRGISGRVITEKHRHNLSLARAGKPFTDAHRDALSNAYDPEKHKGHGDKMRGRTAATHPGPAKQAAKLRGRSKETHPYLARMGEKISALWNDPTYVESISAGEHGLESPHHLNLKHQTRDLLISLGFTVVSERWCVINKHNYRTDIYATRDDRTINVEVGTCDPVKLSNLRILRGDTNVFHIPYGDEEAALEKLRIECGLV